MGASGSMNDYVYFKVIAGTRDWPSAAYPGPVYLSPDVIYKMKERLWKYVIQVSRRGEFIMVSKLDLLLEIKGNIDSVQELI
jgi:hypothetical protein